MSLSLSTVVMMDEINQWWECDEQQHMISEVIFVQTDKTKTSHITTLFILIY